MAINDLHIDKVFHVILDNLHDDDKFNKIESVEPEKLTENETVAQNLKLHQKYQHVQKKKKVLKKKNTDTKCKG